MHSKFKLHWLLVVGLLLLAGNRFASGQAVYGNIFGTATDPSGAIVAQAKVTVSNVSKGTSEVATTNASGYYQVQHLVPDNYTVKFEAKGFKSIEMPAVHVSADTSIHIDGVFQIGGTNEVVTVTEEAPMLKVDRADVASIIDEKTTTQLPVLNRNFTSLELLTPGAVFQSGWQHSSTENPQGSQQIFVNGQKFGGTSWQLDGTDNKDPVLGIIVVNPTLESVGEIKMTTQNFDAEFGNATAGVITAQTRSGSNKLHGSAFYFNRNDSLQARDPFTQSSRDAVTGRYIPTNQYNQFGGSVGGAVIKSKLFYFGDYQGTRRNVGTSWITTVPTATVHSTCVASSTSSCDLSEYLTVGQVYDPTTGDVLGNGRTAFTGNLIPHAKLSSAAMTILSKLPSPNRTGITNNYTASGTGVFNDHSFNVRVDEQLKPAFHVFGRYSFSRFTQSSQGGYGSLGGPGFLDGNGTGNDLSRDDSVATGFDYAVSPSVMTDFRFGYFRYYINNKKYDATNMTAASDLGLPGLNIASKADTGGLPAFSFTDGTVSNFGDINCNCPLTEDEKQIQFVNNWTMVYRNHTFKLGGDLRLAMNLRNASDENRTGVLTFNNRTTASATAGGGLSLATFLTGQVTQFGRFVVASNTAGEHQKRFFFYGQDTWRATRKLTLNLGLRWEDVFPETVTEAGHGGFVDLASGYVKVAGVGGIPTNGGQANNLTSFAPRIGAAYQLTPKTAIRAGFGRSFDEGIFGLTFGTAMTHNIPVIADQTLTAADPHTGAFLMTVGPTAYTFPTVPSSGLIPLQNGVSYPSVRPAKMKLVTVDAYNFSIQRQLDEWTSVEAAFVGNRGVHVTAGYAGYNINQAVLGAGTYASRQPMHNKIVNGSSICCDQGIALVSPDGTSKYNSLQTQINRRMSHGIQFSAFYTYSKAYDNSDDYFNNDPSVQYGPVDYNRDHVFTASAIYELPFGKGRAFGKRISKAADYIVGGWQVSSLTTIASGLPFTYSYQYASSDVDTGPGRPDAVGSFPIGAGKLDASAHVVHYFTPVATMTTNSQTSGPWRRPALYTFGNSGRNSGYGPGMFTSDLSLMKNFTIHGEQKVQFKMDIYNVFNHPVLGSPNSCVDCSVSAGAGEITSLQGYTGMRRVQFGAHYTF